MLSQANAVVAVTQKVLGDRYQSTVAVKEVMTTADKNKIVEIVMRLFEAKEVGFTTKESNIEKMSDSAKLKNYVIGLCNNHWRKHRLLNGDVKYEPTTRRGQLNNISIDLTKFAA